MSKRELIVNLHSIGIPNRALEPDEKDVVIEVSMLEHILEKAVVNYAIITVDDGNISDVEEILPRLEARERKAIFFIPTEKIGQKGYLRHDDVLTLHRAGMEIGSHGVSHVDWHRLSDGELECELVDSKLFLEELIGSPVMSVSCPFGEYDRRVLRFLRKAGYEKAYTSDRGWAYLEDRLVSRNTIRASDSFESVDKLFASGFSCAEQMIINLKKTIKRMR